MGTGPLFQALRVHRMQSAAEISLPFISILCVGGMVWFSYGLASGNLAITIANSVGVFSSATTILVTLYWRREDQKKS